MGLGIGLGTNAPQVRVRLLSHGGISFGHGSTVALWKNPLTVMGIFVVIVAVLSLITIVLLSLVTPANPQREFAGYLLVPSVAVFGVVMIPLGILLKSRSLRRRSPGTLVACSFPRIDLNDPDQRRVAQFIVAGIFILIPVMGVSGYHGYHYVDSVRFCAKACHAPMGPQAVTYEHSAHARVSCVECHVGSGATWFVKTKLRGTCEMLAMVTDSYPRPIRTALNELRPASDTCEKCHRPERLWGTQLKKSVQFAADEDNIRREINTTAQSHSDGVRHQMQQTLRMQTRTPRRSSNPAIRAENDLATRNLL